MSYIERRKFLIENKTERKKTRLEPITFIEFETLCRKYPFYIGKYYGSFRWNYLKKTIDIIERESPKSILELGPHRIPIVKSSDTMDKRLTLPTLTYHHDAMRFPWPVESAKYDLFIALQVWEHLGNKQKEAFKEVIRISRMAILSFPYKRFCPGDKHHNIDEKKIAEWTLHVEPKEILEVLPRIIYFFKFK